MRTSRITALVVVFLLALGAGWWFTHRPGLHVGDSIDVYYAKTDGTTMVPWRVSLSPTANDRKSAALYAAVSTVAGPPPNVAAIRFPVGTHVVPPVNVEGKTVVVNLSPEVASSAEGGFAESAEFKALVWTMTQPALGFTSVRVHVNGASVATLPGGHLELDEPLARSSF
jgi:spore germination protein GerM